MVYFMLELCENSSALKAIYLVKIAIGLITTLVPIILLVSLMISIVMAIIKGDNDLLAKIGVTAKNKILAALIVFLIPSGVNIILNLLGAQNIHMECYTNANEEYIAIKAEEERIQKELEKQQRQQELEAKKAALAEQKRQQQIDNSTPSTSGGSYSGSVDTSNQSGTVTTTSIVSINVDDLAVPLYYSDHTLILHTLSINSAIQTQMHNILYNISVYVKDNQSFIPRFETAGAYVDKPGYHGRGLAIDLFNNWSFTYNGKTYYPYAGYGGTDPNAWNKYNDFICEVCNGQENCEYNINYIIYEKYFKGNGWCWGGNWGKNYFDPMHYELTDGGNCSVSNKATISC